MEEFGSRRNIDYCELEVVALAEKVQLDENVVLNVLHDAALLNANLCLDLGDQVENLAPVVVWAHLEKQLCLL